MWIDRQLLEDNPLLAAQVLEQSMDVTSVPQFGTAARHIRQSVDSGEPLNIDWLCPIVDHYNSDYSTGQPGLLCVASDATPPPPPTDEAVSLAVWIPETSSWSFGDVPADSGIYSPGDEAPFLLTWNAASGDGYTVEVTYDCLVGNVPAIDSLSGVDSADAAIFEASPGPGDGVPDAAVPLPDTPQLDADDGVQLIYLYGGSFSLLPRGPRPGDSCLEDRTVTFPVVAHEEQVKLMGSFRLAHPDDHQGLGAAHVALGITLSASVAGVGQAAIELGKGAVSH